VPAVTGELGGLPILACASRTEWSDWLDAHPSARGAWLAIPKKDSGVAGPTYAEALDVALCHGWIDGQKGRLDDRYWLQRFTPRGPRSRWSSINREHAQRLVAAGEMRPAGLREIERAKADGRWAAAYDGQRAATVPEDLRAALDADPAARAFFDTLDSANRYAILYRVQEAKRPRTRADRIARYVAMLARRETIHQQPKAAHDRER
jgi:uncharacterized protein YdeI (YjbR/CyaY-like superfamily)